MHADMIAVTTQSSKTVSSKQRKEKTNKIVSTEVNTKITKQY